MVSYKCVPGWGSWPCIFTFVTSLWRDFAEPPASATEWTSPSLCLLHVACCDLGGCAADGRTAGVAGLCVTRLRTALGPGTLVHGSGTAEPVYASLWSNQSSE